MEEIVMALKVREQAFGVATSIRAERLYPTCRLVSTITGMPIPRNKAIIGENAFAHESGIHQHGMLRNAATYEIMRPQDVGLSRSHLVLGKHSGRHAFRERVRELGFELDEPEFNAVFARFKALADRKRAVDSGMGAHARHGRRQRRTWSLARLATAAVSGARRGGVGAATAGG
jgi:2-isopropylmalate synthase